MPYWLFKEEPDHYNLADLEKERTTIWDGVTNNLARMHLRKVQAGDRIWYYHTGAEKAVVGEMVALSGPVGDPTTDDPKGVAVNVQVVRRLPHAVALSVIKTIPQLKDWDLVRNSRLSVVPVTEKQWQLIETLANQGVAPEKGIKQRKRP